MNFSSMEEMFSIKVFSRRFCLFLWHGFVCFYCTIMSDSIGRRSFAIKRRGGSGGLSNAEDVAIGLRSGYGLDAIILEQIEG
ncbi:hypothetical protein PVK06_031853 [Gossypium arboreum]|uniref:Uncharacterized protein n=1 Tax=Gossypium arboreum TaxID=29729 RepID=A0ABR0NUN0_GOSAR|nr:hypothetical protein PVK06_031853 [Gossypium arboreum]